MRTIASIDRVAVEQIHSLCKDGPMSAVAIYTGGAKLSVRVVFLGIAGVMISGAATSQRGTAMPVFPLNFEQSETA